MLHPSLTMWCITRTSACSSGASRSRVARKSGPRCRSNGRAASSRARRRTASIRAPGSTPSRPSSASASPTAAFTTCTGTPSRDANTVRRDACRRTTSARARRSAPASSGPARWYAREML